MNHEQCSDAKTIDSIDSSHFVLLSKTVDSKIILLIILDLKVPNRSYLTMNLIPFV